MAKKVTLIVLGVVIGLIGLAGTVGASAALIIANGDVLQTGFHPLTTTTYAFQSSTTNINTFLYDTTLKVDVNSSRGVFVGVGPAASVDQYLSGSAVTTITSFNVWPYSISSYSRGGSVVPAPPAQQTFWVAKGSGANSASINWKITSGSYRLVVMRPDALPNLAIQAQIGVKVPYFQAVAIGGLVILVLLLGLGILLLVLGIRTRPPTAPRPSPGPAPDQFSGAGQGT